MSPGRPIPLWARGDPEPSDSKVLRYLSLAQNAERPDWEQQEIDPPPLPLLNQGHLGVDLDSSSTTEEVRPVRPRRRSSSRAGRGTDSGVETRTGSNEPARRQRVDPPPRVARPRGMFSNVASAKVSASVPLQPPQSPVAPGEVRFSWDFSDAGDQPAAGSGGLRRMPKFLTSSLDLPRGSLHSSNNPLSRSTPGRFWEQPVSRLEDLGEADDPLRLALVPFEDRNGDVDLLSSRTPAPYSAATKPPQGLPIWESKPGLGSPPCHRRLSRGSGPGDAILEALLHQLVKGQDLVAACGIAERILLFAASSLSAQLAVCVERADPFAAEDSGPGLGLLGVSGAFVEQELDLFRVGYRVAEGVGGLLPYRGSISWGGEGDVGKGEEPVAVACIGDGPGLLGIGLLLLLAWRCPSLDVQLDSYGASNRWQQLADAVPLAGLRSYVTASLPSLLHSEHGLKAYRIVVLNRVLSDVMREEAPNGWALFWRDLHAATGDRVVVVVRDNRETFLPPAYVQQWSWGCAMIPGEGHEPAYVLWKRSRQEGGGDS